MNHFAIKTRVYPFFSILLIVISILFLTSCDKKDKSVTDTPEQQVFRHADFEFLMPVDWEFLEAESQPDRVVFQSTVKNDQLVISTIPFNFSLSSEETKKKFELIVEHRRNAENEIQPLPTQTDYQIISNDGYLYAKWGSRVSSIEMRGLTLITLENNKVYTLFLESYGTNDEYFNKTADIVLENFRTK